MVTVKSKKDNRIMITKKTIKQNGRAFIIKLNI